MNSQAFAVITNVLLNKWLPLLASCSVLRRREVWVEAGPYPFRVPNEVRIIYSLSTPHAALFNRKPLKKVSLHLLLVIVYY